MRVEPLVVRGRIWVELAWGSFVPYQTADQFGDKEDATGMSKQGYRKWL